MATLKDKIFEELEKEIATYKDRIKKREEMLERLRLHSDEELNSLLGILRWFYQIERQRYEGQSGQA